MVEDEADVVFEVLDNVRVSEEDVLQVRINVAHAIVLYPTQLRLVPPAQEVMDASMVIIPVVSERNDEPEPQLASSVYCKVYAGKVILDIAMTGGPQCSIPAHVMVMMVSIACTHTCNRCISS